MMNRPVGGFGPSYTAKPLRLQFRDYRLNLLAGVPQDLRVSGNYWQVISAPAGAIMLAFDESAAITRPAGTGGPAAYSTVRVSSTVDQAVVISLGELVGPAPYDRGDLAFSGTINVAASVPTVCAALDDEAIAATTLVQLTVVDSTRRALVVKNPSTSGGSVRIGDSSTTASRGLLLEEGETAVIDGTAAVYAFNPGASAVTLSLLELRLP